MPTFTLKEFFQKRLFHTEANLQNQGRNRGWLGPRSVAPFILVLATLVGGCTSGNKPDAADTPTLTARQTQQWSQSCALCHVSGVGGAPVIGDATQWQPRLDQGQAQLLTHTLEGYANMPPLGYCMSCDVEDFRALIAWMSRTAP